MRIYISGICGSGMAPIAMFAQDCGFQVSGSDAQESLSTVELRNRGIEVSIGFGLTAMRDYHEHQPIDWLIHSAAIQSTHPEIQFAKEKGIKISKRDQFINFILENQNLKLLAVAGTHGKTTTTAMIVWIMQQINQPVSYLIGSNISFGPAGKYQKSSKYLVLETDEYDRNFLNFNPEATIITSMDYDHQDTYPTQQDYQQAFKQFILSCNSLCCAWKDQVEILNLHQTDTLNKGLKLYFPDKNDAINQEYLGRINLTGEHNRQNGFLAISLLSYILKADSIELYKVLNTFPGTQRRFEKIGVNIISDYAHHPTEIRATLKMAREYANNNGLKQVIAVYQPHQNIRQHDKLVQQGYSNCFDLADQVFWLPTYLSREDPNLKVLTPNELMDYAGLTDNPKFHETRLDINSWQHLQEYINGQNLVVFMGAGDIDSLARNTLQQSK